MRSPRREIPEQRSGEFRRKLYTFGFFSVSVFHDVFGEFR